LGIICVIVGFDGFKIDVVALTGDGSACPLVKVGAIGWGPHAMIIPYIQKLVGLILNLV